MKEIVHSNVCEPVVEFDIMLKTAVGSPVRRAASSAANDIASIGRAGSPVSRIFLAALGEGG